MPPYSEDPSPKAEKLRLRRKEAFSGLPRSVRFFDHVFIREIPSMTDEEKSKCWMAKADYLKIRNECMSIVRMALNRPICLSSDELRGLEHRMPFGTYRRQRSRENAIKAVLEEQEFQSTRGFYDPDWIASIYRENSIPCLIHAKLTGMRDEIAIKPTSMVVEGPNIMAEGELTLMGVFSRLEI